MYCAKNDKAIQTINILKDGLFCFISLLPFPIFVTVHAIAAILLLAALSGFYVGLKKIGQHKTQSQPIICAPAQPTWLRGCHGFCAASLYPAIPKNPASPLRKRTGAGPPKVGPPFPGPGGLDAQRGAAAVKCLLRPALLQQANPPLQPMGCFWPTHNCGL